ncbi:hypothetical protein [Clostridium tertium]|uniref:hypothetical protein n=1 Tax=Clostridium tertium TaxID=1559 RepID=UPI0024B3925D|nr:hypothetical protein [Clostridium tertium]MDI9216024.1 hypothetical protein [Clostridium tertium]
MIINIFDNDVATLLLSSNISNLELDILKSDDNKVFFRFKLNEECYKKATDLIEKYETGEIEVNLRKYNFNRKQLLKKITRIKNAQ